MVNDDNRIKSLKKEVDALKQKVDKEKEKLKKMSTVLTDVVTMTANDFACNFSFELDTAEAAYVLSLELQVGVDLVLVRSPVLLDLMPTGNALRQACRDLIRSFLNVGQRCLVLE